MEQHVEKVGVIHVHTRYSDGTGTVNTVARAACRAGVDFVAVTDHDTLAGYDNGEEGWYDAAGRRRNACFDGGTFVVFGEEISPDDGNHYVALGLEKPVAKDQPPARYVAEVARQGGVGFLAHPFYPPPERYPLKTFPWRAWDASGYDGMEIWTYTVDWLVDVTTLPRLVAALLFPHRFVNGPFPETMARWDELCHEAWRRRQQVVGIGSADAHGILYSYRRMFRAVRTHLLLKENWSGDVSRDKNVLLEALRAGRAYVAYDGLHDAAGFRFIADTSAGRVPMGGTVSRDFSGSAPGKVRLRVVAPTRCVLTLRSAARVIRRVEGTTLEHDVTDPGVYRVEAHLPRRRRARPWVFTNPIYVY